MHLLKLEVKFPFDVDIVIRHLLTLWTKGLSFPGRFIRFDS